jgi:orotate phosphoribosyltransferase
MRNATLDPEFTHRAGLLFWDLFLDRFNQEQFQICGCETGGVSLACALQATAYDLGIRVNVFCARKEQKRYGLLNWFEGIVLDKRRVLLVDDIVSSQETMKRQCERVETVAGLSLSHDAFCIVSCQTKSQFASSLHSNSLGDTTELSVLYHLDEFSLTQEQYQAKHGQPPTFLGTMR